MYNRGGKVWVGEKGQGLVFLENDWDNSRLPQDLVEEAGLLGTDFELLSLTERAKLGGYACKENSILFWTDIPTPPHSPSPNSVFLAWEGNDWLSSTDNASVLELKKAYQGGYSLEVPLDSISKSDEFSLNLNLLTINGLNHLISSLASLNPCPEYEISISVKSEQGKMSSGSASLMRQVPKQ